MSLDQCTWHEDGEHRFQVARVCSCNTRTHSLNETEAWNDLLEGLALLARHPSNDISPLHCEHDTLTVMADSTKFTEEELARLDALGFTPDEDEPSTFYSFRFGSA